MVKKLYRVILKGMHHSISSEVDRGTSYVVADNPNEAYQRVRKFLDAEDLGFSHDRALEKIELIAEEGEYPECRTMLFL